MNRDGEIDNGREIGEEIKGEIIKSNGKNQKKVFNSSFPHLSIESILPSTALQYHLSSLCYGHVNYFVPYFFFVMYAHVLSFFLISQDFTITVAFSNCTIIL